MVQEWGDKPFSSQGQVEYAEHSAYSKAKKVVEVAPALVPVESGVGANKITRSQIGVQAAIGVALTLDRDKAYRVIATSPAYLVMWNDDASGATPPVAAAGDFLLPANMPMVISSKIFNKLESAVVGAAGLIQAVEVR
jgi:hypothetical protein